MQFGYRSALLKCDWPMTQPYESQLLHRHSFLCGRTEFSKLEQQLEDLTGKVIVGGVNLVRMMQLYNITYIYIYIKLCCL